MILISHEEIANNLPILFLKQTEN